MSKTEKSKARKARRVRRTKRAKLAILIVNKLIARKPTAKELGQFRKQFIVDAIVEDKR